MGALERFARRMRLLFRSGFRWWRFGQITPPFPIKGRRSRFRVRAPASGSQAVAYADIVIDDCYGLNELSTAALIVDVGANVGIFALAARARFPDARIVAIEPNAKALPYLIENCAGHDIEIRPVALGSTDGTKWLEDSGDLVMARTEATNVSGTAQPVRQVAWGSLALEQEIDLLKLDCEGDEWDILFNTDVLMKTRRMALEYHLKGRGDLQDLRELLTRHDFRVSSWPDDVTMSYGIVRAERQSR